MAGPDTLYTTIINTEEAEAAVGEGEAAEFCPPTSARNLGWRPTRGGQVMIQPCPNGATGLARYYTVLYYTVLYCTVLLPRQVELRPRRGRGLPRRLGHAAAGHERLQVRAHDQPRGQGEKRIF